MISLKTCRLLLIMFLSLSAVACGAEVGPNGNINPDLGPTKMTRCALVNSEDTGYEIMVGSLSIFANETGLKFLDSRPDGAYSSYMQKDDPYFIVDHSYFFQRDPPEHMFITYRSESDDSGEPLEAALFKHLEKFGPLESCDGYKSEITSGWRLKE